MSLRLAVSRCASIAKISTTHQTRLFTSQTNVAIEKLRGVLEEYHQQNYSQELPIRCKKEFLQAACQTSSNISATHHENFIALEGIQRVLANIGASDRVSFHEMKSIFDELGDESGEIGSQKLLKLL